MNVILIGFGLLILIVTFLDFFHTTLSGYGFGVISGNINRFLAKIILKNKNRFIFKYSGFIHLLVTTISWLLLLLLGAFVIFISGEQMVLIAATKAPATIIERFYYTCYIVSTVGIGDMVPGNDLSRIFTSILSFSGFILLTTAMTYLISVVNAVLQKKQLAAYISTLGGNIDELYRFITLKKDLSTLTGISNDLRKMIIKNSHYYDFFPIINYFLPRRKADSAELQLAMLNEVLLIVRNDFEKDSVQSQKIEGIQKAMEYYLDLRLENKKDFEHNPKELYKLREFWLKYGQAYHNQPEKDKAMDASIKSAGWSWEDVYGVK